MSIKKKVVIDDFDEQQKRYFDEIAKSKPLTREEEFELCKDYRENGNIESRNKLVEANLKFVATIANSYRGRGLSYSDLIAEGNVGLIRAMDKFEPTRGYKVISYSVWWIRQAILEAIDKRNSVGGEELPQEYEEQVSDEAESVYFNKKELPTQFVEEEDEKFDNKQTIFELMSILDDRENEIISRYFGLSEQPTKLEEIGNDLGLSKERVRQIMEKGLKKMRSCFMERQSLVSLNRK